MISFRTYVELFNPVINELQYLSDFLNKKGNAFLDELLNRRVVVNLKIDQSAFVVGNDSGEIKYFGREGKVQITPFRRQGADLYEKPIAHLEKRKLTSIPSGVFVYIEFFDDNLPTLIRYTQKPKNNMIISYVKRGGKIVPPADPINKEMADLLAISPPPVLFDGKLSSDQKKKLIEYVSTPDSELGGKYGGKNFVQYVLSLFTTPKEMKYLMTDKLEGMVFYFDDGKQVDMAKINDPSFTAGIKEKSNKDDQFHKKMMEIVYRDMESVSNKVFAGSYNINNFAEKMTREYMRQSKDLKRLDQYKDRVTSTRFARLGFSMLPKSVLDMVNKVWYSEDIYRTLHFMFEKEKKRANPRTGLTRERKEMVNSIVNKLRK